MKRFSVFITRPATNDLKGISNYIGYELREPSTAKKFISKVKEAVMGLSEMPTRYPLVADERLAVQGIRKLIVDNYIVFYIVSEQDAIVTVVRILYDRRNWENLL